MGRLELSCHRFAVLSGVRQEAGDYSICIHPLASGLQRKGTLALLTEPAGDHPSLGMEACRLAQRAVIQHYFADSSLSLTSSLMNALDNANGTLLQYNYNRESPQPENGSGGGVAVQAGGVRTKRAKVGLTAVLLRPDGTGLYMAQLSPTQAYIVHNGILSAIPEPPSWQAPTSYTIVPLSRVPRPDEETEQEDEGEIATPTLPAPPLGSGPGIEVDLVYRRVEPGDLVVMISSSLARYLNRTEAEALFASGDGNQITDALYSLAVERGMAEAHACILQLGVESSSGVETDYNAHMFSPQADTMAANGGVLALPHGPHISAPSAPVNELPGIRSALKGPREWLSRRRNAPSQSESAQPEEEPQYEAEDEQIYQEQPSSQAHQQPTEMLLQRSLDLPPYRADMPIETEEQTGELEFDGWEDSPPALDGYDAPSEQACPFDLAAHPRPGSEAKVPTTSNGHLANGHATNGYTAHNGTDAQWRSYQAPTIFGSDADYGDQEPRASLTPDSPGKAQGTDWTVTAHKAMTWTGATLRSMLPERVNPAEGERAGGKRLILPTRLVIALAVVALAAILVFSISTLAGKPKQKALSNLLQQAQQEDLLANKPAISDAEQTQHLSLSLEKAKAALAADPQSADAKTLSAKVQTELDKAQGVTRLPEPKMLFDLDEVDKTSITASGTQASSVATSKSQLSQVVVQGNDAYVLDREKGKIYRCRLSAQNCAVMLSAGDSAGGQKVGALAAITLRVSNLVALDSNLVAYVYNADTSAWQAQPLGGADALDKPKGIASYDGNLYLLAAKPGQVSKYPSGGYGQPPTDWIQDPASVDQMKSPVAMAIDGAVYVLLGDGNILVMQGGKVIRTITPKATAGSAPTDIFTSTDAHDLYLLRAADGSITRMGKEGQTLATFKGPANSDSFALLGSMTVDEGRGKLYLTTGRRVYEAALPSSATQSQPQPQPQSQPRPTAEPESLIMNYELFASIHNS